MIWVGNAGIEAVSPSQKIIKGYQKYSPSSPTQAQIPISHLRQLLRFYHSSRLRAAPCHNRSFRKMKEEVTMYKKNALDREIQAESCDDSATAISWGTKPL